MSKPYRIQITRAQKRYVRGKQWHIKIIGGNGEEVAAGETKPRKDHTRQTAQSMIQSIVTRNFIFEVWNDRTKKFVKIPTSIFG